MTLSRKNLLLTLLLLLCGGTFLPAQLVYEFNPAGATGNTGPTQFMVDTAYAGTSLDGDVTCLGGIQYWIVPSSGNYLIEAYGGQGYGPFGGRGAHISGEFNLVAGDTLKILVGQMAGHYLNYPSATYNHQFGGGGGSFVTTPANTPLVVAGGGGGNHGTSYVASCDGQIGTAGASGANGSTIGAGGTNGQGGLQASSADGGGGLLTNGTGGAQGQAFVNGGLGGIDEGTGGFGCGGGTSSWNNYRGGGGGGYSGGGGGNNGGSCCPAGGGGGSFNAGSNPVDLAGVQIGDGLVRITSLTTYANNAGVDEILGFTPPVCKGVHPVKVVVRNFGNNQITPVTVEWSVNGAMQTPATSSATIDTSGGSGNDTIHVMLGTVNITMATSIKAWTTMPNAVTDSSNFDDTTEVMIAAPAVVSAVEDGSISCFGASDGGATASGSGGTPGYSFVWSTSATTPSVTGLAAGTYTVQMTDLDGCTDSVSINIGQPTQVVGMESVSHISCNGETDGQIIVNPTGGTPGYQVVWSPGGPTTFLDSLAAGAYMYTITDANGCLYSNTVVITEPPAIALSTVVTDETLPGNGAIDLTVSGGTGGYTFIWSNGATTEDLSGITGGTYTVYVTDANGCVQSVTVTVNSLVAVDPGAGISFQVYPNPNNGSFKVSVADVLDDITIEVSDILGQRIELIESAQEVTEIQLNVGNGVYFIKISDGTRSVTQRVIVAK